MANLFVCLFTHKAHYFVRHIQILQTVLKSCNLYITKHNTIRHYKQKTLTTIKVKQVANKTAVLIVYLQLIPISA